MTTSNEKSTAALVHLSTLSQYIIPFGNYIFPIIIWSSKKNESAFINQNGKQALNFQLSMLLYTLVLLLLSVPTIVYIVLNRIPFEGRFSHNEIVIDSLDQSDLGGVIVLALTALAVFGFMKIIEFILVIYAAVKASNGQPYQYPLSISFFK